jgi:threonine synthase
MRFVSTRGGGGGVGLADALRAGLAADGGLYVPELLPALSPEAFNGASSFDARAAILLAPFFDDSELASELGPIVADAFSFDAPLRATKQPNTKVLELFHGPTAAFKDFGARFLAACLTRLPRPDEELTILVATSGDTGAAVAAAFHRRPNVRVVILYPEGLVSERQAHQLGAFGDNVIALRVAGAFDDCQRLAKQAFADAALRQAAPLASANSINIGRLLPQMAYYADAALTHAAQNGGLLNFAIPSGNLGNAFACALARAVGAPIGDIMLASNANATIPEFFLGAPYRARPSVATLANAMDVGDPSNFERFVWLYKDDQMLRANITAARVDDATIEARIRDGEGRYGVIWDPHAACAIEAVERQRALGDRRDWCVVATAHPAKFDDVVEPLVGRAVAPPPALADMLARPSHAEPLRADYAALRARLLA